jgi:hypothetical protein
MMDVITEYASGRDPAKALEPLSEEEKFEILVGFETGPWAVYPNPMRSDGVFLCVRQEPKPIPGFYDADGHPVYQQVPDGLCWPAQLPFEMAYRLAERLNEEGDHEDHQSPIAS